MRSATLHLDHHLNLSNRFFIYICLNFRNMLLNTSEKSQLQKLAKARISEALKQDTLKMDANALFLWSQEIQSMAIVIFESGKGSIADSTYNSLVSD